VYDNAKLGSSTIKKDCSSKRGKSKSDRKWNYLRRLGGSVLRRGSVMEVAGFGTISPEIKE
jgi:hypothetical protein